MLGMTHLARQMMWIERDWPDAFARATRRALTGPQYWAWRLTGVLASEVTSLAAQSGLWCAADAEACSGSSPSGAGARLLPPLVPAWAVLGPLKSGDRGREPASARAVSASLNGIHDSSANLYRYQGGRPRRHRRWCLPAPGSRRSATGRDRGPRRRASRASSATPTSSGRPLARHADDGRPRVRYGRGRRQRARPPRKLLARILETGDRWPCRPSAPTTACFPARPDRRRNDPRPLSRTISRHALLRSRCSTRRC